MKKVLALVLALCLVLSFAVGCSNQETNQSEKESAESKEEASATPVTSEDVEAAQGEFVYWSCLTGDSATWEEARIQQFMEENEGITVDLQFVPDAAGIRNGKLLAAIAGGTAPDLILSDDYASSFSYAANGSFEPMEEFMSALDLSIDFFFPAFHEMMQQGGHTYLVPMDATIQMFYYRKSMVEAAGLDPENPPQTIDELDAWAEALTIPDGDSFKQFGFIPWLESGGEAFIWPRMWNNNLYDIETNKLCLTDDAMVSYFDWMQSYAEKYDPAKIDSFSSGFGGMFTPDHPFMTGKIAMVVAGNWFTEAIHEYAPGIEDDYDVAPIPVPESNKEAYGSCVMNTNVWSIPKGHAENGVIAVNYMKFGLRPEVNADNFYVWRALPTNEAAIEGVQRYQEKDPIYLKEVDMALNEYSKAVGLVSCAAELGNDIKALRDKLIYDVTLDPATELKALEEKFQAELDA